MTTLLEKRQELLYKINHVLSASDLQKLKEFIDHMEEKNKKGRQSQAS